MVDLIKLFSENVGDPIQKLVYLSNQLHQNIYFSEDIIENTVLYGKEEILFQNIDIFKRFVLVPKKLMEIAEKYGFTVVNGMNLVPHDTKYFQDHSVHPADSGFNHYAENLIKAIEWQNKYLLIIYVIGKKIQI